MYRVSNCKGRRLQVTTLLCYCNLMVCCNLYYCVLVSKLPMEQWAWMCTTIYSIASREKLSTIRRSHLLVLVLLDLWCLLAYLLLCMELRFSIYMVIFRITKFWRALVLVVCLILLLSIISFHASRCSLLVYKRKRARYWEWNWIIESTWSLLKCV